MKTLEGPARAEVTDGRMETGPGGGGDPTQDPAAPARHVNRRAAGPVGCDTGAPGLPHEVTLLGGR